MKYTIHYTLRADGPEGEVIEATVPEEPFTFQAGSDEILEDLEACLLYTSPSPRDGLLSRMPSSA